MEGNSGQHYCLALFSAQRPRQQTSLGQRSPVANKRLLGWVRNDVVVPEGLLVLVHAEGVDRLRSLDPLGGNSIDLGRFSGHFLGRLWGRFSGHFWPS